MWIGIVMREDVRASSGDALPIRVAAPTIQQNGHLGWYQRRRSVATNWLLGIRLVQALKEVSHAPINSSLLLPLSKASLLSLEASKSFPYPLVL